MSINIYKFLEKDYMELYSIGTEIDNSVFISPHSVIVKSRVFIEQLIKNISNLEELQNLNELNLSQRISILKHNGIIDNDINEYLHETRLIGNQAAHENVEEELVLALKVHKNIYKVTGWFIETYVDYNFKTPIYKNPKPINNNSQNDNSNMFMKLMGKMEDLLKFNKSNEDKLEEVTITKVVDTQEIDNIKENKKFQEEVALIRKSECLIEELSRLKESSREAVEGLNVFTDFKKYMHVDRNAQMELEEIILEANKQTNSQLILVCGSVGDGKSHIISYFK